jgi:hypothetical protein
MNKQVSFETLEAGDSLRVQVVGRPPFASAVFVFPAAARLTEDQAADVGRAGELVELGAVAAATAILGHVERALGVSPEDHIAGSLAAEAWLGPRRAAAMAETATGQADRAASLTRTRLAHIPELNEAVRLSLAQADEARVLLTSARERKARGDVKAALADIRKYHDRAARLRREQLDAAWSRRAETETQEAAWARGEETDYVDAGDGSSVLRISTHDGLATLYEAGSITTMQWKAGRRYRALYEASAAGLKIASMEASGGGHRISTGFNPLRTPRELQRASVLGRLAGIERAICPLLAEPNRPLIVLRRIAGDGHTLRALSPGGNAKKANLRALIVALNVAARVIWEGPCESGPT